MWCTTAGVAGIAMEVPRVFGPSGVSVFTGAREPATLLGDSGLTRTVVPATHVVHATVGAGRPQVLPRSAAWLCCTVVGRPCAPTCITGRARSTRAASF